MVQQRKIRRWIFMLKATFSVSKRYPRILLVDLKKIKIIILFIQIPINYLQNKMFLTLGHMLNL